MRVRERKVFEVWWRAVYLQLFAELGVLRIVAVLVLFGVVLALIAVVAVVVVVVVVVLVLLVVKVVARHFHRLLLQ